MGLSYSTSCLPSLQDGSWQIQRTRAYKAFPRNCREEGKIVTVIMIRNQGRSVQLFN